MSATTATLPSPQAWSPGVGPNVSTTPMGLPQRTPSSVGQMTAPILGKPGTAALSPRLLRDSCNSYFGIVDFSTANPANSSSMHTRKAWNLPAGSSPVKLNCNTNNNNNNNSNNSNHCNRHSSEHTFEFEALRKQAESAGFISGHRISSSFEKQTQAQRDRGRNAEEKRVRQSPISPHTTDASWTRSRYDDMMTSYMSIDPRPNTHTAEVKSATAFVKPIYDNIPTGPNSAANITCPVTPVSSEGGAQPMRLTLPQSAQNSFAMHRSRPLQRSETSPASVDQGNVIFISPSMCAELLKSSPGNTLFLDVRPYPQFTEARIKGALNLCIPTTLLKRPSFNLQKLQDTFAGEEKEGFARWQISTRIVVYDESTTHMKDASTLINVLKKFTSEGWKGEPSILRGGFAKFSAEFPEADFWRVVWEQDIRVIVMLTAESEGPQVKCHPYWKAGDYGPLQVKACTEKRIPLTISPQSKQQHQRSPSAQLTTNNINTTNSDSVTPFVTIRHLTLAHTSFPFQPIREITQLQYAHWPDFGTPAEPAHLVRLIEEVNRVAETTNGDVGNGMMTLAPEPEKQRRILVHCSAGCGRTGTFCTVDSVVDMLKRQRMAALASKTSSTSASVMTSPTAMETSSAMSTNMVEGEIEDGEERGGVNDDWLCRDDIDLIAATVEDFRLQRLSMVQSLKQFVLCYESVLAWIALHEVELVNGCVDDEHQLCPGIDRTMTAPLLAPLTAPSMTPLARKGLGGEEEGSSRRSYDE
ncbi:hypothetical protein PABG_11450 [Paracoccidioides brasiliensis Pb03]|nr:hypothetical protein PABG_11450 [Paracoccidioides brasiliensis Pb03]